MDVMVHPSRIATYFKDKVYTVIIHLLVALSLCIGTIALLAFNQNYFTRSFADDFIPLVQQSNNVYDIEYKDDTMTGTRISIEYGNFVVYLSNNNYTKNDLGKYVLVFGQTGVSGYYNNKLQFTEKYSDFGVRYSFELENVRNGSVDDQVVFADLLAEAFDNFENVYALNVFVNEIEMLLMTTAIAFAIMLFYSYLINPTIKAPVRLKLTVYDLLIFFFVYTMYEIIQISLLQYVAYVIPVLYTSITFRHIIRISRKDV